MNYFISRHHGILGANTLLKTCLHEPPVRGLGTFSFLCGCCGLVVSLLVFFCLDLLRFPYRASTLLLPA